MFLKILTRLWGVFLLKINEKIIRRLLLSFLILFISIYFFQDWEGYFHQLIDVTPAQPEGDATEFINKLFYLKILKYVTFLSLTSWIVYNLSLLSLSKSSQLSEEKSKKDKEQARIQEEHKESISETDDYLDQLDDIEKNPKLKTYSEKILDE